MQKKIVLLALEVLKNGISGPDTWAYRLLLWLRQAGVDARVAVILRANSNDNLAVVRLLRESTIPMTVRRARCMREDTEWFIEQARECLPGLFIAHGVPAALMAAANLREVGIRSAMMVHSDDPYYYKLIDAFVLSGEKPAVDVVVTVSQFLKQKLEPLLRHRVSVENIHCGAPHAGVKSTWNHGDLHLLYVGRFCQFPKRVVDIAKAFCAACDEVPGVVATMVGDGPDRKQVEAVLQTTAGGDRVTLTGALLLPEVLAMMPSAHVIVLMSDFEGNPISLMEGMAAGLVPIVTFMPSGIPEHVFDGDTGYIVENRGAAFVAAVRRLRENPELWRTMSASALKHFTEHCSPEKVVEAWCRQIGQQPKPFILPKNLRFPVYSWWEFWVDGSMAKGSKRLRLMVQRAIWNGWESLPSDGQKFIRRVVKTILSYDGGSLQSAGKCKM